MHIGGIARTKRCVIPRNMKCVDRTHPSHASRDEEKRQVKKIARTQAERWKQKEKGTAREDESSCIAGVLEMAVCRFRLLAANQVFHLLLSCTPSPQFPLDYSCSQIFPIVRHDASKKMLPRTHQICVLNGTLDIIKESLKCHIFLYRSIFYKNTLWK